MITRPSRWPAIIVAMFLLMSPATSFSADRLRDASSQIRQRLSKKISITFKKIDADEALKILSEQANVNMAVSSGVRGSISVFLTDVDVVTALDIVTEMTGNAYVIEGDIIRVLPEEDYERQTGNMFRIDETIETYGLEHIPVADAVVALSKLGLVTSSGKVFPDAELNSLVIWDVAETHERVRRFVEVVDQPAGLERAVLPLINLKLRLSLKRISISLKIRPTSAKKKSERKSEN